MFSRKTEFRRCVPAGNSESSLTEFKGRLSELIEQSKDHGRKLDDLAPGESAYTNVVEETEDDAMETISSIEDDEDAEGDGDYEDEDDEDDLAFRPISLERRAVLRPNVVVPVKITVALQKMYKGEQAMANELYSVLDAHVHDSQKKRMRWHLTRTTEE